MASVNFFADKYRRQPSCSCAEFYLTDPGENRPAAITLQTARRQATVHNPDCQQVSFIPIDHNIPFKDTHGNDLSVCDGMLCIDNSNSLLAFVEMKDQMQDWLRKAVDQLARTIELFKQNHVPTDYRIRTAYAANKSHPNFHSSHKELMARFKKQHGFLLRVTTEIKISQ